MHLILSPLITFHSPGAEMAAKHGMSVFPQRDLRK